MGLPVGHGGVENLLGDVLYHHGNEFILHLSEQFGGVVGLEGRELLFKVLFVVGVVDVPHVDSQRQLHL